MTQRVNLNADMGEGFGAYDIGDDRALLEIVRSANIACGMHAGDPNVMYRLVMQSKEAGVSIGAHPGFNDLWGFGRRRIDMHPRDVEYLIAYQIGALAGLAAYAGLKVTHVKPHGALNNMAAENLDLALAIGRAIQAVDKSIIYVALSGSEMDRAARRLGLPCAREAFIDRQYDDDGNLASRKVPGAVITDAKCAVERAVRMVLDQEVVSHSGMRLKRRIDTLCVHGDAPNAIDIARAARAGLERAGIKVVPLTEMALD